MAEEAWRLNREIVARDAGRDIWAPSQAGQADLYRCAIFDARSADIQIAQSLRLMP